METQLDIIQGIVEEILERLTAEAPERESPFDRDDDAPPQFQPAAGVEKILGPKPHPSDATNGTVWRREAAKIRVVRDQIPDLYKDGVITFAGATGIIPVFFETVSGKLEACLEPDLTPWIVNPVSFLGSNVEGLIRAVKGPRG